MTVLGFKMWPISRYDDTSKKLNTCEENLQITESKLSQNEKILEKTIRDKRKMEGDIDVLEKENFALKEAVETSKCSLEEEILLRVDIEHQLQSTKEEMNFKQQMFNKVGCQSISSLLKVICSWPQENEVWN